MIRRPRARALRRAATRAARRAGRRLRRHARRSALAALTTSALALPGLGPEARADAPAEQWSAEYAASFYREDDVDASRLSAGSPERYRVESHQLAIEAPLGGRADLGVSVLHETMSGASPWVIEPDVNGDPTVVMTGASIEEQRTDLLVRGSYYTDQGRTGLVGGVSSENDYLAVNGGIEAERSLNEGNTTLSGGLGISLDRIEPVDRDLFPSRPEGDKQSYSVFASVAQVLSRNAAIQTGLTVQHAQGLLSDPYKLVSTVSDGNLQDSRPDQRTQLSWLTRYRHHFARLDGTLHADYRLYLDDWNIRSHTFELAWYQTLWDRLRLVPSLRYYSQSQAEFYAPFFERLPADGFASSDYRLSPYGALSWKLLAETTLEGGPLRMDWRLGLSFESYRSSGDLALGRVLVENPALVDWSIVSLHLAARF